MSLLSLQWIVARRPSTESPQPVQDAASRAPAEIVDSEEEIVDSEEEVEASSGPTPEQVRYARVLEKGTHLGLLCLFVTFPLYILGALKPHVPVEQVQKCWSLPVHEYQAQTGIEPGLGWVRMLARGDFLNYVGIVILASVTAVSYLAILPRMFRRRDMIYAVLAILQVVVLVLAASGVLAMRH